MSLLRFIPLCFFCVWLLPNMAAQSRLFYAGNAGSESFKDIVQLSDGTILIAGTADDLNWIPATVTPISLTGSSSIANNQGSNKYGFLLHTDSTLNTILNLVHLPANAAEDISFIKSTNAPRTSTGDLYISGNTEDSNDGGYFIAKLNNNFVNGIPTALEWSYNAKCSSGSYPKKYQPWDVDAQGRVYFARGDSHAYNWSAMFRLKADGNLDVVENWRTHWVTGSGEFRGTPASSYSNGGAAALSHSGIVFKRDGRCNLRSWTQADYDLVEADGNGGRKQGRWPLDVLFSGPCDPQGATPTSGPGYTGYSPPATFTYGPSSICVDRRNGDVYLGLNTKSVLPSGLPDFEPAVIKMNSDGALQWWSRLYHEIRPDSSMHNSTPDQYVDGLAIDYSSGLPSSVLVVNARCHGNNVENLWEGNQILANPNANAFQNRFTGTSGNIHISWLGKLSTDNATLLASTYVAELGQGTTGIGSAHSNPLMDGWPNMNTGWPNVNTTYLKQNTLKVTADGSVLVLGRGRRPMTTSNAYFKMPNPYYAGRSAWSYFVRQYQTDFSLPQYSSIVRGVWDTVSTEPSLNVEMYNIFKTRSGIIVVGQHDGVGGEIPVSNVPSWGQSNYNGESAILGYFEAAELLNPNDDPVTVMTNILTQNKTTAAPIVYPNPTNDWIKVQTTGQVKRIELYDIYGRLLQSSRTTELSISNLPNAVYIIKTILEDGKVFSNSIVKGS